MRVCVHDLATVAVRINHRNTAFVAFKTHINRGTVILSIQTRSFHKISILSNFDRKSLTYISFYYWFCGRLQGGTLQIILNLTFVFADDFSYNIYEGGENDGKDKRL